MCCTVQYANDSVNTLILQRQNSNINKEDVKEKNVEITSLKFMWHVLDEM